MRTLLPLSAAGMERALHPDLVKRIVRRDTEPDQLMELSAGELVSGTAAGGGSAQPESATRDDVTILDMFGGTASVRIDAGGWVDYLHVAKIDDRWLIVNVLWELRAPPG